MDNELDELRRIARLMCLAAGCSCIDGPGDEASDQPGEAEPQLEPAQFDPPELLEPPSNELTLRADRDRDISLRARGVVPGLTRVFVDGVASEAVAPSADFQLTQASLTIRIRGALVPGDHQLALGTLGLGFVAASQPTTVRIVEAPALELRAEVESNVQFEADSIVASGFAEQGVLAGVNLDTQPVSLVLARAQQASWQRAPLPTIELIEFTREVELDAAVAAASYVDPAGEPRFRVAWRSGPLGAHMLGIDASWDLATLAVQNALTLDGLDSSIEYAQFGRPVLLGDMLIAEALLARDVEAPRPGARTLLTSRIDGTRFGPTVRSYAAGIVDVDAIAPALDPLGLELGRPPTLGARLAGVHAVVFDVEAAGLNLRPRANEQPLPQLQDIDSPLQTVLGAMGSRHVFAHAQGQRSVFAQRVIDTGAGSRTDLAPADGLAELSQLTQAPIVLVLGGVPLAVFATGRNSPAVAVVASGAQPQAVELPALSCDELAVPALPAQLTRTSTGLACRRGRDVLYGTLSCMDIP